MRNILESLKSYSGALALISKLNLWTYFAIPILISFAVAFTIGILAFSLSDNIGQFLSGFWGWDWGKDTFSVIGSFIGGLVIVILGLILFKHIIMALSAPFMGPVSEKIEAHYLGNHLPRSNSSFIELLWRGIRVNGRNLIMELLITLPLLLLKLIPVINLFSTGLIFVIQAYYAGFGNMDYTLERHKSYNESLRFVKQNKGLAIGNGIGFLLLLLIPFVGVFLVLPLSVTSATITTVKHLQKIKQSEL